MKVTHLYSLLSVVGLLALVPGAFAEDSVSVATTTSSTTSGGSTTATSTTTVTTAPTITTQPASLVVDAGANATFTVAASGDGTLRYQWFKNGRPVEHATSATLTLSNTTVADAGVYAAVVSNEAGRVVSNAANLDVNVVAGTITTAPQNQTVNAGATATFTVATSGSGLTYQWRHDGRMLAGETNATLTVANAGALSDGTYTVVVKNSTDIAAAASAMLTVHTDARLTNISTRGHVGANDDQLIVGFVIRGQGSKQILMRAVGPTLKTNFGLTDALATPKLTLIGYSHGKLVTDSNSGWANATAVAQASTQVGAFPLVAGSADAALLETADSGAFTGLVTGLNGSTGIALAEVYDADTGSPTAELVNISARARVGAEAANTLIAGFAVTGTTSDTVMIRGVGPTLGTRFGLREALGASQVTLFDAKGNQIAVNSGWAVGAHGEAEDTDKESEMDDASDRVGAFHLDHGSHDSAMVVTLAPGIYTAHVTGVNQSTGIALVEIYEVR